MVRQHVQLHKAVLQLYKKCVCFCFDALQLGEEMWELKEGREGGKKERMNAEREEEKTYWQINGRIEMKGSSVIGFLCMHEELG